MPTDQRSTSRADRCSLHPGSAAVATCDGCRRPLCLACATPVRGLVYGVECLPPDLVDLDLPPGRGRTDPLIVWQGIGLFVALIATCLPWTRFGHGSGLFGAWNASWAGLAALAFGLGALAWLADRARPARLAGQAATILAVVGLSATILALLRPAAFARPWVGHWAAIAGGALAVGAALVARRAAALPAVARRRPRLG